MPSTPLGTMGCATGAHGNRGSSVHLRQNPRTAPMATLRRDEGVRQPISTSLASQQRPRRQIMRPADSSEPDAERGGASSDRAQSAQVGQQASWFRPP